jgi:hypothetical protein
MTTIRKIFTHHGGIFHHLLRCHIEGDNPLCGHIYHCVEAVCCAESRRIKLRGNCFSKISKRVTVDKRTILPYT